LELFGYFKHANTSDLWSHNTRPISFTLVVDNFGVKNVKKEDVDHLIASFRKTDTLTEDRSGTLYCSIALEWDLINRKVNISMPGYIQKKLQEYNHIVSHTRKTCPYPPAPKLYGTEAQVPLLPDLSPKLDKAGIKHVQQNVGSILYYACTVDMTVLLALIGIAAEQTIATKKQ
jgi:hypothetical protein